MRPIAETEHGLCNAIIQALNYAGLGYFWRENSGMVFSEYKGRKRGIMLGLKGKSDILGVRKDGKFVAIEVKLPGKQSRLTIYQKLFLERIAELNGVSGMVTSVDEAISLVKTVEKP